MDDLEGGPSHVAQQAAAGDGPVCDPVRCCSVARTSSRTVAGEAELGVGGCAALVIGRTGDLAPIAPCACRSEPVLLVGCSSPWFPCNFCRDRERCGPTGRGPSTPMVALRPLAPPRPPLLLFMSTTGDAHEGSLECGLRGGVHDSSSRPPGAAHWIPWPG